MLSEPPQNPVSTSEPLPPQIIEGLPFHQKAVAIVVSLVMLAVVIELVRKRKLREEYSILWIVTATGLLAMAIEHNLLTLFQRAVGAVAPTSALFFGGLAFLILVSLQYSVRISKLTVRNKTLCQKLALLERDITDLRKEIRDAAPRSHANGQPEPSVEIPRMAPPQPEALPTDASADPTSPRTPTKPTSR